MFFSLVGLGFVLSLDNFRTAVTLGPLRFRWWRSVVTAAVFGFFDGLAPLVGILLGDYLRAEIAGPVSGVVGPAVLGLYGLFLLVQAAREKVPEDTDYLWCVFGLPVPLSLDNLVAGTGLGLAGLSPLAPAAVFGAITFVMSVAGLQLGRGISYLIPIRIRWEFVTGVALMIEAILLGLGVLD
jgi:putative Mn2+ efflux pump MntP